MRPTPPPAPSAPSQAAARHRRARFRPAPLPRPRLLRVPRGPLAALPAAVLPTAVLAATAVLAIPAGSAAQERAQAFRGAEILPITGPPIAEGTLVVQDGRIVSVGPVGEVRIPQGAEIHDVTGRVIMPGLVDTHSHIGDLDWGSDDPIDGDTRILDVLNVRDAGLERARAGGITTANIMPGSGQLMSGQTLYVKLREGHRVEDLLFCADPLNDICGGMKMANGTNPLGSSGPGPQSRARSAALVRERLLQAEEYRDRVRAAEDDPERMPPRDLELEAIVEVLDGDRVVHHHTHRHDDVLTVLRLQEEFGFRLVLQHVSDAALVADEIAAAGFPASVILVDAPGGKLEAVRIGMAGGAALEEAGALVGFHTDDWITESRYFLRQGGLAVRAGMSREGALYGLTMAGARMLDLEDRIGSLEPGKDADFVVLSGDPLSVYTRVQETWIEGRRVFDLDDPEDRAYAVGGFDVEGGR